MGKIKVLHVIGGGEFGGAEQYLLTLLRSMDRSAFELHTACLFAQPLAPLVRNEGFPARVLAMKSKLDFKPVGQMSDLIMSEGFDIVHTHGVRANLIGRLAARKAGLGDVVTTVHSVLSFDYSRWLDRHVNRLCEMSTRSLTKRFVTISHMLAGQLASEGVSGDKIVTIHNGLEIENYDPEISGLPVRKEFGINPETVVAGIVARLHPVKGHLYLLQAVVKLIREVPGLLLMIVGTGPDREKLEDAVRALGLGKNVIFTGFRKDIPEVIAALDILVVPSISEGLGLTVMEGMAMKKPVVAFRVGGIPEIITSGQDGILVPPLDTEALASALLKLVRDKQMASEIGAAARATIEERFSAGVMAEKTAQLYRDLIEGGQR